MLGLRTLALTLLTLLLVAGGSGADTPLWEIDLEESPDFPVGKVAMFQGMTDAEGVRCILKNLSIEQPVVVNLAAQDVDTDVRLKVAKDTWDNILREGSTKGEGSLSFRFRTADAVAFVIESPEQAEYQMMVWVGPETEWAPPPQLTSMKSYRADNDLPETEDVQPAAAPTEPSATPMPGPPQDRDGLLYGLLASNLLALCAIALLLMKGRRARAMLSILLGLSLVLSLPAPSRANSKEPKKMTNREAWDTMRDRVDQMLGITGASSGNANADEALKRANQALLMAKLVFDYLDPKEARINPNYRPDGLPELPSRGQDDPNGPDWGRYQQAEQDLNQALELLEKQRAIYMAALGQAKAAEQAADLAASMSPLAGLVWAVQKSDPKLYAGKKKLETMYDANYKELMRRANEALLTIAALERSRYGDYDWYSRYGLPYYLFLHDRYRRS